LYKIFNKSVHFPLIIFLDLIVPFKVALNSHKLASGTAQAQRERESGARKDHYFGVLWAAAPPLSLRSHSHPTPTRRRSGSDAGRTLAVVYPLTRTHTHTHSHWRAPIHCRT